jgi:hypothetical protein
MERTVRRELDKHLVICSDVYSILDCYIFSKYCIYIDHPYESYEKMEDCDKIQKLLSWSSHIRDRRLTKEDIKQWLIVALSLKGLCLYHGRIENYNVEEDHVNLFLHGGYKVELYSPNITNNAVLDENVTRVFDHYFYRDFYNRGEHEIGSTIERIYCDESRRTMIATSNIPTDKIHEFEYSPVTFKYFIETNLPNDRRFYLRFNKRESCFKIKEYDKLKERWHTQAYTLLVKLFIKRSAAFHYKTTDFLLASRIKNS